MAVQETPKPHLKVFISYSHHDKEFGQRLHARLLQDKLQLWMDWKDIPVTVEWWDKIQDGILACDNFLVIISPNSIASLVCNLEIAHAIALNKRIVPVLFE